MMITYEFPPTIGGVSHAVSELALALMHRNRMKVTIAACESWPRGERQRFRDEWNGIEVFRIKYTGLPRERLVRQTVRTIVCFLQLANTFLKSRPDVLICHRIFDLAIFGGILGRCSGRTTIGIAHGPEDGGFVRALSKWRFLMKVGGTLSNAVVANNTEDGEYFLSLFRKPAHVIPNIVHISERIERDEARKICGLKNEIFQVLFAGGMHREYGEDRKGLGYLIRAVAQIPECGLHVFGEGPMMDEYKQMVKKEDCAARVVFYGKRRHEEVNRFMCGADMLVVPSLFEGCPMVVLEAMELGLPVAATQSNGLRDLIRPGETGLVIKERDVASIVAAIHYGMNCRAEVSVYANRAQQLVRKYANQGAVAGQFEALIKGLENREESSLHESS